MRNTFNPLQAMQHEQRAADAADAKVAPSSEAGIDPALAAKATKAAVEFESFFISHMLHQMRESTRTIAPEDSPYKDKVNQDMQDMADNMLAGNLAGKRAFGVADAILKQILPPALNKTS